MGSGPLRLISTVGQKIAVIFIGRFGTSNVFALLRHRDCTGMYKFSFLQSSGFFFAREGCFMSCKFRREKNALLWRIPTFRMEMQSVYGIQWTWDEVQTNSFLTSQRKLFLLPDVVGLLLGIHLVRTLLRWVEEKMSIFRLKKKRGRSGRFVDTV